jgi:hypothetical protein
MTKARAQGHNWEVLFEELPATLQDAVTVTVGLGYIYIWIDSLCTLSDDEGDKNREIAMMLSVYSNAIVTIAVTMATTATQGFLEFRSETIAVPSRSKSSTLSRNPSVTYCGGGE